MESAHYKIGLFYEESAYMEPAQDPQQATAGTPAGLMGRHVAGKEFLNAFLNYGTWSELAGFVTKAASGKTLVDYHRSHPSSLVNERRVEVVEEQAFHARVFPGPPATLIHFPFLPEARYAWARQHGEPGAFALSGVTHTFSLPTGPEALCNLVTAPFEPYDTLVCTSRATADVVRATTGAFADDLRHRFGGKPGLRLRLETIPVGVDLEKFRPPTPEERAAARRTLGAEDDEVVVLFVGRLSLHAKAHPFPMFDGVARAARAAGRKVHLILSGWAAMDAVLKAYNDGGRVFAPGVRVTIVDGVKPQNRAAVWHAADIFVSLSDTIQEFFGQVIGEAMASGLPVVASDWNGYRDRVVEGETGFLVPTYMVRGATADASSRLVLKEVNYDHFLAECNQTVVVDLGATAEALRRLIADDVLRQKMGTAGRARAVKHFAWPAIIEAYERLWGEQEQERRSRVAHDEGRRRIYAGPACLPAPEHAFASYPTAVIEEGDELVADENARERLKWLLDLPLTNYMANFRSADLDVIRSVLEAAASPRSIVDLDEVLAGSGIKQVPGRATLAWMLKYGLLLPVSQRREAERRSDLKLIEEPRT